MGIKSYPMNSIRKQYLKCGRIFSHEEINLIQTIVKEEFHTNRCEISRTICKKLNWYSENGKLKEWPADMP